MTTFSPGALVRARAREWVVLPSSDPDLLLLRPLGGSEAGDHSYAPLSQIRDIAGWW